MLQRTKSKGLPIHQRKMFKWNGDIQQTPIRNLWSRTFPHTRPHFSDTRARTNCFLGQSGTISGPSRDFGASCHSVYIGILDQLILQVWCVGCERKCGILIRRHSPSSCTRYQQKWMRSTGRRARKSHRTLMLQRVRLHANALCVVNLDIWECLRWYLYQTYLQTFKHWWFVNARYSSKQEFSKSSWIIFSNHKYFL